MKIELYLFLYTSIQIKRFKNHLEYAVGTSITLDYLFEVQEFELSSTLYNMT